MAAHFFCINASITAPMNRLSPYLKEASASWKGWGVQFELTCQPLGRDHKNQGIRENPNFVGLRIDLYGKISH